LLKDGKLQLDWEDEIVRETLLDARREVVNPRVREFFSLPGPAGCAKGAGKNMKMDLLTSLLRFSWLAAFIGFEVIRRVSPLLHTPLMSLTNALDAIAVVGAILPCRVNTMHMGRRSQRFLEPFAIACRPPAISSRFPDYRPHAENVQGQRGRRNHDQPAGHGTHHRRLPTLSPPLFSSISLKWLSSPKTARRGVFAGELGMLLAIVGTLLHQGIVEYKWIFIALVLGTIIGVPLGEVAMTAVPQRTALKPRVWRLVRHASRHSGVLFAHSRYPAFHDGRALAGSNSWLTHVHRQLDGCGKTARNCCRNGRLRTKGKTSSTSDCWPVAIIVAGMLVASSGKDAALSADCRHPAFVRRDDDSSPSAARTCPP